jgi:FlaA1/EpsC-like NDP-sugar epimerase
MTIPEAASLVIQSGSLAKGGEVFVLDMGEAVRIQALARRMIHLSGFTVRDEDNPQGDIAIEPIGLRPGEKLHEELLLGENRSGTEHPRIQRAREAGLSIEHTTECLERLEAACKAQNTDLAEKILAQCVTGFARPQISTEADGPAAPVPSRADLRIVAGGQRPPE